MEQAGRENNYIFGGTVEELAAVRKTYSPRALYGRDAEIRRTLDRLTDGTFRDPDGGLAELKRSLLDGASWHAPDHYFVLYDFHAYLEAKIRCNRDTADTEAFAAKALRNIAGAGKFSSDRTILEYAEEIWKV